MQGLGAHETKWEVEVGMGQGSGVSTGTRVYDLGNNLIMVTEPEG